MSDTRASTNTRKAVARPGETHAATGVLGVAPFASIAVIELAGTLGPGAAITAAGVGAVAAYRHVATHRPRNPDRKRRTTGTKATGMGTAGGKRNGRRGAVHVPGSGRRKGHGTGTGGSRGGLLNPFKRGKVAGHGSQRKNAAASVGTATRKGAGTGRSGTRHNGTRAGGAGHGSRSILSTGGKRPGGSGSKRRGILAGLGNRRRGTGTGTGSGSTGIGSKRATTGSGGKSSRGLFGIGRRKNRNGGHGGIGSKRRGGLLGGLFGRNSTGTPTGKIAKDLRKKRNKAKNRRVYRRVLDRFKRARKLNKRFKDYRKPRGKVARFFGGLWSAGRFSAMCLRVAGELSWYVTAHAGHALGRRVRAINKESVAFLAVPFAGLGADVRRLFDTIRLRFAPVSEVTDLPVPQAETRRFGPVISEGSFMSTDEFYCETNLRPLIEAIRSGSALGGGEKPHALVVWQWHKDLQELAEALGERIGADAEIAANTLPVSGDAHEITVQLGRSALGYAGEVAEGRGEWEDANGTRLQRLISEEQNKESWDWSTRPQ